MESGGLQVSSGQDTAGELRDPSGIVFDTSGGISLEEQREILAGINAMSAGNRLAAGSPAVKAKKRGFLFPLCVNIGAFILLGLGFVLLSMFHGRDEQSIQDSSAALGLTERKMIQEIRHETNRQITEKENEINGIRAKLSEADAEYRQLQVSVENLTEEQKERAAALLSMQEEYNGALSSLEAERARIIEDSRQQEANLRIQNEERLGELSSQVARTRTELSAAVEELNRLSSEQERIARAEDQMAFYYTSVNERIAAGNLDEAADTLATMKELLNAPSLRGIASLEARKQIHFTAIAALEEAVARARSLQEAASASGAAAQGEAIAALEAEKAAMEQTIKDQEQAIAAYSSDESAQSRMITENTAAILELRTVNASQQQELALRENEIEDLTSGNEDLNQRITDLNITLTESERQKSVLDDQLTAANIRYSRLNTESENIQTDLNNTILEREAAIETMRGQIDSIAQVVEQAIETPEIQNLLGPVSRREIITTIQAAVRRATQGTE